VYETTKKHLKEINNPKPKTVSPETFFASIGLSKENPMVSIESKPSRGK